MDGTRRGFLKAAINPRLYSPARPNARLLRRQGVIRSRMGGYAPPAAVPVSLPAEPAALPPPSDAPRPFASGSAPARN